MDLREELAAALLGRADKYDRADAVLRCVVEFLRYKQEIAAFNNQVEGSWAIKRLADELEAMIGKEGP